MAVSRQRREWLIRIILGKVPLSTVTEEDRIAAEHLAGRAEIVPPWVDIPEEKPDDPERAEAIERLAYAAKVQIKAKYFQLTDRIEVLADAAD